MANFPRAWISRKLVLALAVAGLAISVAVAVMMLARGAATGDGETGPETAVATRGDLVVTATGSGTLNAPEETLGFSGSGEMTVVAVNVAVGDLVQPGDVLAAVDEAQALKDYQDAQRAYADLTSVTAQAAALREVADAQTALQREQGTLEYLISPEVMYWEGQVSEGGAKLDAANAALQNAPADETLKAAVDKAVAFVDFAQDKLAEAHETYLDEYVPATFGIKEDLDVDTYNVPSDLEIRQAHLAVTEAEKALKESREYYEALKSGVIPEDTTNASLLELRQAKVQLEEAKANYDGSRIVAPFAGTVMEVNVAGGDVVEVEGNDSTSSTAQTGTSDAQADPMLALLTEGSSESSPSSSSSDETLSAEDAIVLADTGDPYLEVYWNESDWPLLSVGSPVEITFDDRDGQVYTGRITEIDRELQTSFEASTIRGEVALDSPFAELALPIGASADVTVVGERAQGAVLIPIEALHEGADGSYVVFVVVNGESQARDVTVGLKNDTYAAIKSGLQTGEVVLTGSVATQ